MLSERFSGARCGQWTGPDKAARIELIPAFSPGPAEGARLSNGFACLETSDRWSGRASRVSHNSGLRTVDHGRTMEWEDDPLLREEGHVLLPVPMAGA